MKLSQARLREIIQEEVARMNEDEHSPSPERRVYNYVKAKTKYTGDDLNRAAHSVIAQIKRNAQEAGTSTLGELGPLPKIVTVKMMQAAMREKGFLKEEELEETRIGDLNQTIAQDPERTTGQQNAIEAVKKEFMKELGSLTGIDSGEADIFKFLLEVLKLLKNTNANTTTMRTALGITRKAAEKIAK